MSLVATFVMLSFSGPASTTATTTTTTPSCFRQVLSHLSASLCSVSDLIVGMSKMSFVGLSEERRQNFYSFYGSLWGGQWLSKCLRIKRPWVLVPNFSIFPAFLHQLPLIWSLCEMHLVEIEDHKNVCLAVLPGPKVARWAHNWLTVGPFEPIFSWTYSII